MTGIDRVREMYAGRRVGVVGLGREGLALSAVLAEAGAEVLATDGKPLEQLAPEVGRLASRVQLHLGGLSEAVLTSEVLFVSPGVPLEVPLLERARQRGLPLWNETGLFLHACPAEVVGITGSAGKSTSSALTAALLAGSGLPTHLGGNIGIPLIAQLARIGPADRVVIELSSFQLDLMHESPAIAAVTNVTPNHLDRHHTMAAYSAAKANILRHQSAQGLTVLNWDDPGSRAMLSHCRGEVCWFGMGRIPGPGAHLVGDSLVLEGTGPAPAVICRREDIRLRGKHHVANVLLAATLAQAASADPATFADTIRAFRGLPHRLELVEEVDGVAYVNDSLATTPERTQAALEALEGPVVLLIGGRDKHLPWDELIVLLARRVRHVVLFGELAWAVEGPMRAAGISVLREEMLPAAVRTAARLAQPGDTVLLSPGGTSFDAFRDFAERGECFRQTVRELKDQHDQRGG